MPGFSTQEGRGEWRGFDVDKAIPVESLRHKLVQHKWSPAMIADGHFGGHGYMFTYGWNKRWVAPHLLGRSVAGTPGP